MSGLRPPCTPRLPSNFNVSVGRTQPRFIYKPHAISSDLPATIATPALADQEHVVKADVAPEDLQLPSGKLTSKAGSFSCNPLDVFRCAGCTKPACQVNHQETSRKHANLISIQICILKICAQFLALAESGCIYNVDDGQQYSSSVSTHYDAVTMVLIVVCCIAYVDFMSVHTS